jgi:pyruvate/2-oxoglutarate dehydrogenase complex dihydrolipoamide acyltransferase (E2) component
MPNLRLRPKENLSSFRRIAIGTWETTKDPQVYGALDLRADEALRYLAEFRAATGKRATLSHLMAKAVSHVLHELPDANAVLRWNRIYLRDDIGVFFQVEMKDPVTGEIDLSGATLFDCHEKSLEQIVDEFSERVGTVKAGKDKALEGTRSTFKKIPFFLLNKVLNVLGFLSVTLNLDLRRLGIPKDPFGSVMVTNIGSLGLDEAYVPLVPYSHVPLLLAVGAVKSAAVVEGDRVVVGKVLRVSATFDHRVLDGSHAAKMSRVLRAFFDDPFGKLGPIPAAPRVAADADKKGDGADRELQSRAAP